MDNAHILVVDDDHRIRSLLSKFLHNNGYFVTSVKDTKEAREALDKFKFDLIVLDVMLPNELGTDFAYHLRKTSKVAILMLTAMGSPEERIKGLEAGADDYIAKPFEPKELILRIKKLLHRTKYYFQQSNNITYFGNTKYDGTRNLLLNSDDESIPLSTSEAKLLKTFITNQEELVERELLAEELNINLRSVDVQVTRLRNKIEINPKKPIFLQTIRGKGYILYAN